MEIAEILVVLLEHSPLQDSQKGTGDESLACLLKSSEANVVAELAPMLPQ